MTSGSDVRRTVAEWVSAHPSTFVLDNVDDSQFSISMRFSMSHTSIRY